MADERIVQQRVTIDTTPDLAFEAVTADHELREWMCELAWTDVRPGGRYEARWDSGYRAEGKLTVVEAPRRASVSWKGTGEPGETEVTFGVEPVDGGVAVTVTHRGFGPGAEWNEAVAASRKGWSIGLENLKSTLETGVDLRIARRPFMGITFDILDPARAAKEGIAAEQGVYVNDTVEGSGARAAGLAKGDVILSIDGREMAGYSDIGPALNAHQAGDVVRLEVVRGQERRTVKVMLGSRPSPDVPDNAEGLAQRLAALVAETDAELTAAVEGLTEAEAERQPAEGEWSVKQVLAHLSIVERDSQCTHASMALDGWLDGGPSNQTAMQGRLEAALMVTPTLPELLARFLADERETIGFLRALPEATVAHKARFRRIAQSTVGLPDHTREHIGQIKAAVAAVRAS